MRKIVWIALFLIFSSQWASESVLAAVTEEEVNSVLSEKGITRERLQEIFDYYEITLEDFESTTDLSDFIGTPITDESLLLLLDQYGMTRSELVAHLEEFGMTIEEHFSIEELDLSIDFVLNNDTMMEEVEGFLSAIGLTDEEAEKLFSHFESLDELTLESKMEEIGSRLEELMMLDPEAGLTDSQKQELENVWEEMIAAFDLQVKIYQINENDQKTAVSFSALTELTDFSNMSLLVEVYNTAGELLMDVQLSEDMLTGDFVLNAAEKVTDIADLAGELTNLRHEAMPDTASNYGSFSLLGLVLILAGFGIFFLEQKKVTRYFK